VTVAQCQRHAVERLGQLPKLVTAGHEQAVLVLTGVQPGHPLVHAGTHRDHPDAVGAIEHRKPHGGAVRPVGLDMNLQALENAASQGGLYGKRRERFARVRPRRAGEPHQHRLLQIGEVTLHIDTPEGTDVTPSKVRQLMRRGQVSLT
jgi:hypothetical protein